MRQATKQARSAVGEAMGRILAGLVFALAIVRPPAAHADGEPAPWQVGFQ